MKSNYLQRQVDACKQRWEAEYQRQASQLQGEFNNFVRIQEDVERDVQRYLQHYSIAFIVKECAICFVVSLLAAALISEIFIKGSATIVFILAAAGYVFLKRHPALDQNGQVDRQMINEHPELRFLLNPNLIDIIRVRMNYGKVSGDNSQKIAAKKAELEEDLRRFRAHCEQSRDQEIEQLKADFKRRLQASAARMQSSQYPVQIGAHVMPEVQKMLQSHRNLRGRLEVRISVTIDEIAVRTNTGMEKHFSFASFSLANLHDDYDRIALATMTARQVQLEVAKAMPGMRSSVTQVDSDSFVTIGG